MRTVWKVAGWVGGAMGAAASAAATAMVVHSNRIARERRDGAGQDQDGEVLGALRPDREYTVTAADGVPLSVEEVDPADGGTPEATVVLVHGYTLDRRCWHFQRRDLARSTAPRVRLVLYDHRSHGRSGRSDRHACNIEQLGRDLEAVIRAAAPEGPLVLIGHSMGGMTIMALAEHDPELFADRVRGVALLNTSAGDIGRSGLPRPFLSRRNPAMVITARVARGMPDAVERGRKRCRHLLWGLTRWLSFGDAPFAVADLMDTMMCACPAEVMMDFLPTLGAHNRYAALAGLQFVEALVIGSDGDRLVQFQHSEAIAALLPDAELVCVSGTGHMTMMEQPRIVTEHLQRLLSSRYVGPTVSPARQA
ncbi:MAG: alpha/beta fold hydrolase [Pseudonocardiaceae bacterium]